MSIRRGRRPLRAAGGVGLAGLATLALGCGRTNEAPDEPAASSSPADAAAPASRVREVALIDSLPWSDMLGEGVRHRIVVRTTAGSDTIPGVATTRAPVVVGHSTVHGFDVGPDGAVTGGFVYDVRTNELRRIELPGEFLGFTAFALAPDAGHLAYAGRAEDGIRLAAIVRRWPDGAVAYHGGPVRGYPSDAANSDVEWLGPDRVEIRIRLDDLETPEGTWLRVRGSPAGSMVADTVRGSAE